MVKIAPSILTINEENLRNEIIDVTKAGADYIHIDVMDGKFVPNETNGIGMLKVSKEATNITLDVHLMIEEPEKHVQEYLDADIITFHIEAVNEKISNEIIEYLRNENKKVGIAIKPKTSIETVIPYLEKIDMVLIMTVEPGYGGQKFMTETLEKISALREKSKSIDIEVDGGINAETAIKVREAGANVLVSGTAIFKAENKKEIIEKMKK